MQLNNICVRSVFAFPFSPRRYFHGVSLPIYFIIRVVKTITEAVGDLNINSADAAAAIHAKCLICDKPVTATGAVRARTAAAGLNKNRGQMVSSSMPLLGYSKALDDSSVNSASGAQEGTMFNRLTSSNPAVAQGERVKVATELAIMRSSIEPLPEINVSYYISVSFCRTFFVLFVSAWQGYTSVTSPNMYISAIIYCSPYNIQ